MISVPAAIEARCALHPEEPAGSVCTRCGAFCCGPCTTPVFELPYCPACAALPEVNYLEALRRKYEGRRDGWAWVLGGWAGVCLVWTGLWGRSGEWVLAAGALAFAGVGLGCFLGQRWARHAQLGLSVLVCLLLLGRSDAERSGPAVLMGGGLALRIYLDPRHRLFFRLPVKQATLRRLWHMYEDNPLASVALMLGVFGLLLPFLAPGALVLGGVALRRVDPEARPPVGRRGQALGALGLGMLALVLWGSLLGSLLLARAAGVE